jgi:hypothetical protein
MRQRGHIKTGKVSEGTIATAGDRMFNSVNVKAGNRVEGQDEHPTQRYGSSKRLPAPFASVFHKRRLREPSITPPLAPFEARR